MARENMSKKQRAKIAKKRAEYFKENYTTIRHTVEMIANRPSDDLIAEAQRRAAAPHRDLAGMFFNDPPFGYSMLDRRAIA